MCVREITAFHEILIDPASWTRRGREREREGVRGEGWRGGIPLHSLYHAPTTSTDIVSIPPSLAPYH